MGNLGLTILIAAIIVTLAAAGLGIGLLITGKSRLKRGCGKSPDKKGRDECSICGEKKDECDSD